MRRVIPNLIWPYLIWAVLALPAVAILSLLMGGGGRALHHAVGESGQWGVRLLILTLCVTPLTMLFKGR